MGVCPVGQPSMWSFRNRDASYPVALSFSKSRVSKRDPKTLQSFQTVSTRFPLSQLFIYEGLDFFSFFSTKTTYQVEYRSPCENPSSIKLDIEFQQCGIMPFLSTWSIFIKLNYLYEHAGLIVFVFLFFNE